MMKILLLLLIAATACHSLPPAGQTTSIKAGVKQLVTASEQLQSWGRSFIQATNNGLDEIELSDLRSSASKANANITKAVEAVKAILGESGDETTVVAINKALDILLKGLDEVPLTGVTKLALLSAGNPLAADGVRLYVYVNLFEKGMKALDTVVERLRGLLDQTDAFITAALPELLNDLVDESTVLVDIFNGADSSFQDAVFASRSLRNEKEEEKQTSTRGTPKNRRRRRSFSVGVRVRGGLTWRRGRFTGRVFGQGSLTWGRNGFRGRGGIGASFGWRF